MELAQEGRSRVEYIELDIVQRKVYGVQGAAKEWDKVIAKRPSSDALPEDAGELRKILHNMRVKLANVEEKLRREGPRYEPHQKQRAAHE